MLRILDNPLRETVNQYLIKLRRDVTAKYHTETLVWASRSAFGGKMKPPAIPDLLRF